MAQPARRRARPRTRTPQQERARQTVDAILEATRVLLVQQGLEGTTTNAVADKAGVSIGSLYQYFEDLDAIVEELVRRHVETSLSTLLAEAQLLVDAPLEEGVRRLIRMLVEIHSHDPELHRVVAASRPGLGARAHLAQAQERVLEAGCSYLSKHRDALVVDDLRRAAFVVTGTMEALTHDAVLYHPDWLHDGSLVEDLSRMVLGYLTGRPTGVTTD